MRKNKTARNKKAISAAGFYRLEPARAAELLEHLRKIENTIKENKISVYGGLYLIYGIAETQEEELFLALNYGFRAKDNGFLTK